MDHTAVKPLFEEVVGAFRLRQKPAERSLARANELVGSGTPSRAEIDEAIAVLEQARAQVAACSQQEAAGLQRMDERLRRLRDPQRQPFDLEVSIYEHLAREGAIDAARAVHDTVLTPDQRGMVDLHILSGIADAAVALGARKDLGPATEWARLHASRLRRLDSSLEFDLARMRFIELLREGRRDEARAHAEAVLRPAATAATAGSGEGGAAAAVSSTDAAATVVVPAGGGGSGAGTTGERCMKQLGQCLILATYREPQACGVRELEELFADKCWDDLLASFKRDALAAAGYRPHSLLQMAVAMGITALKTPSCVPDAGMTADGERLGGAEPAAPSRAATTSRASAGRTASASAHEAGAPPARDSERTVLLPVPPAPGANCPCCHPHYLTAVVPLAPHLRRSVTRLIDPVTREEIDERNPPLVLPNGRVYATKTVELLTSADGSAVLCPRSGDVFARSEVRKAYFM